MLVESIDQSTHTVIPELDHTTVQTGEDPWPFRVEGEALHSVTLCLELRQHIRSAHKPDHRERKIISESFRRKRNPSQADLKETK